MKYKNKEFINFDQILNELNMSYETYILALRSTINKKKIFLKRSLEEIYINSYMSHLLHVWKANHDIQYVLDPYSCVVYICDYLMKNNKGMSKISRSVRITHAGSLGVGLGLGLGGLGGLGAVVGGRGVKGCISHDILYLLIICQMSKCQTP